MLSLFRSRQGRVPTLQQAPLLPSQYVLPLKLFCQVLNLPCVVCVSLCADLDWVRLESVGSFNNISSEAAGGAVGMSLRDAEGLATEPRTPGFLSTQSSQ